MGMCDEWEIKKLAAKRRYGMLGLRSDPYTFKQGIRDDPGPAQHNNLYLLWKYSSEDEETTDDPKQTRSQSTGEQDIVTKSPGEQDIVTIGIQRPTKPNITDLSNEILLAICQDSSLTESDWYYLCYVPLFHDIATSLLYSEINCHEANTVLVLKTLATYPKRGALIRTLDVEFLCGEDYLEARRSCPLADGACPRRRDHRTDAELRDINNPIVRLLILCAPNLKRLSISDCDLELLTPSTTDQPQTIDAVDPGYRACIQISHFQNLRRLHIEGADRHLIHLAPLFKLPRLEILSVMGFNEPEPQHEWTWHSSMFGPERASSITTLDLFDGSFHADVIPVMLKACRSLKAFAFDACRLFCPTIGSDPHYDFSIFNNALAPFTRTLEYLSIHETHIVIRKMDAWKPLHSLVDFTSLICVRVDFEAFFGPKLDLWPLLSSRMPESIKEIHMDHRHRWPGAILPQVLLTDGPLSDIAFDATVLPNLEYMTIDEDVYSIDNELSLELKELLESRGVDLQTYFAVEDEDAPGHGSQYNYTRYAYD